MPSIISGFEYDIFISYRHKDNRNGNVTEFVEYLKKELEATFKEDVSIYFDTNAADGLLENHHVDKSLEGKLRCLIFIPIISQTYCDPKSFAWQHEFCSFNKLSKEDQFGRDIKLSSGNVASRILPIRVHDLDSEDRALIEKEIGGVLRAIEFIYKEPGVNRPLSTSDKKSDNQSNTDYKNQINKVANAIKEIIYAMKNPGAQATPVGLRQPAAVQSPRLVGSRWILFIFLGIAAIALLTVAVYFFSGWGTKAGSGDRTIAVIPFKLIGDDKDGRYLAEGVAAALINHLNGIPNVKVRSRTSVEKYEASLKTIPEIGRELNVNYVLEGSAQKYKNNIRIIVQLVNSKTDEDIWFKEYNESFDDIFKIQTEIAMNIASELNVTLGGVQKRQLQKVPTKNAEAYDLYLRGMEYMRMSWKLQDPSLDKIGIGFFKRALSKDADFAMAYSALVGASWDMPLDSAMLLLNKAIELDRELPDPYEQMGFVYQKENDFAKAKYYFEKAISLDSLQNNILSLGKLYSAYGQHLEALAYYSEAFRHDKSDFEIWLLYETGMSYSSIGEFEMAKGFAAAARRREPENVSLTFLLEQIAMASGNIDEVLQPAVLKLAGTHHWLSIDIGNAFLQKGDYVRAARVFKDFFAFDDSVEHSRHMQDKIAYAFVLQKLGKPAQANANLEQVKTFLSGNVFEKKYHLARYYAVLGDKGKALDELEKWKANFSSIYWLERDPTFAILKNEPRYKKLITKYRNEINRVKAIAEFKISRREFPTLDMLDRSSARPMVTN